MTRYFVACSLLLVAACSRQGSQAQTQAPPSPPPPTPQAAAPAPEPPPSFERVRQFRGQNRKIAGGARMQTMSEVAQRLQPSLRTMTTQELGLGSIQLGDETTHKVGENWVITYPVSYNGIPFSRRSSVDAIVGVQESEVRTLTATNVPSTGVDGTQSTVSSESAAALAKARSAATLGVTAESNVLRTTTPELVFEAGGSDNEKAQLCWLVTVSNNEDVKPHKVQYAIKAIGTPTIVRVENLIRDDHFGTVMGVRWDGTPLQATVDRVLPFVHVARTSPPAEGDADATAKYRLTGTGSATITGSLKSPYFNVINKSTTVSQLTPSASGSAAGAIDLKFAASSEHEIAQVSAFFWTHRARTFAGDALNDSDLKPVSVYVNIDDTCNASFAQPASASDTPLLRLYRGGPMNGDPSKVCVNRAYADTIFHEYGHAIDWALRGIMDLSYSEGFGDAMAILFTRADCYGRDSYGHDASGTSTCMRKADNTIDWPSASEPDPHVRGQIYSGFVFELVKEFKKTMTADKAYELARQLTVGAAVLNPTSIQDAVAKTLQADDNDGDVTNGTPHLAQIKAAATKKKLWKAAWDPTTT